MRFRLLSTLSIFALASLSRAVVGPGVVTGNVNPVADPTMCRSSSGEYFVFSTAPGIEIRTSPDRTAWTLIGVVWPDGAPWTDEYTLTTNGNLWAPDCTARHRWYILSVLCCILLWLSKRIFFSAIFFAKSTTGLPGSFTNEGLVTSTATGATYNAIDPKYPIHRLVIFRRRALFLLIFPLPDTNGEWWLSLGSFWSGIKLEALGSSTGKPSSTAVTSLATRTADSGAIEASVIYKFGSFYYLFSSWDICCEGTSSTYNIRVGRSSSVSGPYVDQSGVDLLNGGGTLVLASHDNVIGPGGQDLYLDVDGTVMVYHYYTSAGTFLGINLLDFSSGWPVVV
ncbi:Arabinan endo-1,5-alpha-L-arabinosidase [Mycena sanguinolenta]|uniref:Endo-1,5-alpha-L-arabinanase A n=1 Tax=Mycena sanguinolenta TaxID=230812 RepID=A0A8H6XTC1_9AGAR|nr:Arabinan endo-1,5-alpha-L-arabinosidase [Mycena sanguinolenta]